MILDEESSDRTAAEVDLTQTLGTGGSVEPATPVDASDPGIPTGNILLNTGPVTSPQTLLVQAAIVVGAALLVGTVVFLAVRAAVGTDEGADDVQDESAIIDPGPSGDEVPGVDNSSRSGSRRDTPGNDGPLVTEEGEETVADADEAPAAPTATEADDGTGVTSADADVDTSADVNATSTTALAPATTVPLISGPSDTGLLQPTTTTSIFFGPITSLFPPSIATTTTRVSATTVVSIPVTTIGSTTTSLGSSSTAGPSSTIASTTTSADPTSTTTSSTLVTTTTLIPTSTTSTTPPVGSLIESPADGSTRLWETFTRFRAEDVGADKYCWTVSSGAGDRQDCISDVVFDLPGSPVGVLPGPLTVKAEALDLDGNVLAEDAISIELLIGEVAASPASGADVLRTDDLLLRSNAVSSATRYCWTISQGVTTTGEICGVDQTITVAADDTRLDVLDLGATRIRFAAYRGLDLVGTQEIIVNLN